MTPARFLAFILFFTRAFVLFFLPSSFIAGDYCALFAPHSAETENIRLGGEGFRERTRKAMIHLSTPLRCGPKKFFFFMPIVMRKEHLSSFDFSMDSPQISVNLLLVQSPVWFRLTLL